ncbi:hypothetical protein [Bradyrhizobium sp. 153]|uniref:hypothetical protein n=1 Tax=Bradyrhizobium sp. 153 TaxID=2782627 RepID=UPI001FFB16B4|nr:hypothetical protein [Bradyrhizobium sp. 153]MCK1669443.1 hypothetical protein [Bradyrhizobium sp. 153]
MTAPLTARMAAALRARRPLALLAEIEHPSGAARLWTGVGPLQWNGQTFRGSGTLGTITPIKHTSGLAIQEINFGLAGVDPLEVAKLDDNVRNLAGRVWLACIDPGQSVVPDPYQVVDAQLDYQTFAASADGVATISITARTGFYSLERALDEAWTSEEQKLLYPADAGLDMIPALQNQDLQWTPA